MLVEYAVKEAAKKELTEANYKEAYKNYTPETSVQVIKLDAEDKAKSVLKDVKADGADFAKIAKEKQQLLIRKLSINLILQGQPSLKKLCQQPLS